MTLIFQELEKYIPSNKPTGNEKLAAAGIEKISTQDAIGITNAELHGKLLKAQQGDQVANMEIATAVSQGSRAHQATRAANGRLYGEDPSKE